MKRRFLITGAAGFVGRYVVDELTKLGEVVTLGRKGNIIFDLTKEPTSSDKSQLPSAIDTVIHLAALTQKTRFDSTPAGEYQKQNVLGTKNLLTLLDEIKIRYFIYVSTLDVYGDTKGKQITEKTKPAPLSPYAKSKYEAERLCAYWTSRRGVPFCIARLGLVYGPGEEAYEKVIPQYIRTALKKVQLKVYGDGQVKRDFIYAGDVARALQLLIEKKATGIYNIASGSSITINDLAELINNLSGNTSGIQFTKVSTHQNDISFTINKLRHVGFKPDISLETGLSQEIMWFRNL